MKKLERSTFNLPRSLTKTENALEKTIANYDEFYSESQKDLNEKMELITNGATVWETMAKCVAAIEQEDIADHMHSIGQMTT